MEWNLWRAIEFERIQNCFMFKLLMIAASSSPLKHWPINNTPIRNQNLHSSTIHTLQAVCCKCVTRHVWDQLPTLHCHYSHTFFRFFSHINVMYFAFSSRDCHSSIPMHSFDAVPSFIYRPCDEIFCVTSLQVQLRRTSNVYNVYGYAINGDAMTRQQQ